MILRANGFKPGNWCVLKQKKRQQFTAISAFNRSSYGLYFNYFPFPVSWDCVLFPFFWLSFYTLNQWSIRPTIDRARRPKDRCPIGRPFALSPSPLPLFASNSRRRDIGFDIIVLKGDSRLISYTCIFCIT